MHDVDAEARRQQALLAALAKRDGAGLGLRDTAVRAGRGLAAYRANAQALAERALTATFPTVQAMLGEADFAQLARALWRDHPPQRGDIAEWGDALPAFIEANPDLAAWPWLADCARLDLAVHRCERAADQTLDTASLALLAEADPARLQLVLVPGVALIESRHPIATIHAAHRSADADPFVPVRAALAAERSEAVWVARHGWRAGVHSIDASTAAWLRALLDAAPIADALTRAGATFDFAAWLATALRQGWLKAAVLRHD